MGLNCGEAIGPILGGILTNHYSFNTASISACLLIVFYATIYTIINYNNIKSHFNNYSNLNEDKKEENDSLTLDERVIKYEENVNINDIN